MIVMMAMVMMIGMVGCSNNPIEPTVEPTLTKTFWDFANAIDRQDLTYEDSNSGQWIILPVNIALSRPLCGNVGYNTMAEGKRKFILTLEKKVILSNKTIEVICGQTDTDEYITHWDLSFLGQFTPIYQVMLDTPTNCPYINQIITYSNGDMEETDTIYIEFYSNIEPFEPNIYIKSIEIKN